MGNGQQPDDLRWPIPSDDTQPFEVLEVGRDGTADARWRLDDAPIEMPDVYLEWQPKRRGRLAAADDDDALELFAPAALGPAAIEQAAPGPATLDLPASRPGAASDEPVPPLRLSLVTTRSSPALPPAPSPRTFIGAAERLSLLGAGALMGALVALAVTRAPTSARPGDAVVRPPANDTTPRRDAVPAASAASVTSAAPAPIPAPAPTPATREPAPTAPPASASATTPAPASASASAAPPTAIALAPPPATPTVPARSEPARPTPRARTAKAVAPSRPAPPRPPPPVVAATVSEAPAVLGTVQQYAAALSRLDARATQSVWPSVDRESLVQSFSALREQQLTLAACKTTLSGDQATVSCRGTLRYRPRVGDHSTRVEQGRWTFDLARHDGGWAIASIAHP